MIENLLGKIYHSNCLDLIELLPDSCIDAIITDFPYGINFQSNFRVKTKKFKKIDNDKEPYIDWIEPSFRILKDEGRLICFYRWDVQNELVDELERVGFNVKSQLVWDKKVTGMGDLYGEFSSGHELMIYATKGRYEFKGKRPRTVYSVQRENPNKLVHPNEKPVDLNRALIRDITEKNEVIFDPFSGSGSCSIAAYLEGRRFIACDTGEDYVNLGNKRIQSSSLDLFN